MHVESPRWVYISAGVLLLLGSLATLGFALVAWLRLPGLTRLLIVTAPAFIALNVLASLYNSWTYDFQPQGRYLFPSLVPLAVLLAGTVELEPRWLRTARLLGLAALYLLGLYVVWSVLVASPLLMRK
jgi:hypothetical protein